MKNYFLLILLAAILFFSACGTSSDDDQRPYFVATTMMLEDALNNIGGDLIRVDGLMGPGVDPHIYRATPRDFQRMERADLIIYNGIYLEARLSEILERMPEKSFAAAEVIPENQRIEAFEFGGNYDPHVWFDVALWTQVVQGLGNKLEEILPDEAEIIRKNTENYISELDSLHIWVTEQIATIPDERRVLITAHDAFQYFGNSYDIEVLGLQGLSTQSEVGLQDVRNMVLLIIDREIPAIFLESSIAPRSIQSIINGVTERGGNVSLGGELYSDAMGQRGTVEGTYIGMIRHNVTTIVEALK